MKISKHLHSCLLVEENNLTFLFDPGNFSYENQILDLSSLVKLDYILITHQHPDHMYLPFIKELLAKFSQVKIITNSQAAQELKKEDILAETNGNNFIKVEEVMHEQVFDLVIPKNYKFTLFNKLTDPGDSFHFDSSAEVLAMPIQAPWGSLNEAVAKIEAIKPKIVIPIHDFHWRDEIRKGFYTRLENYFKDQGIIVKGLETGEVFEC